MFGGPSQPHVNKIIDIRSIKQEMTVTPWPFHPSDVRDSGYVTYQIN